jgi:3-phenylpropionate/trans-cinnamate dioxygenase ferredoxin subunit
METGIHFVKIADSIDQLHFAENNIAVVFARHKKICIAKSGSGLTAFSAVCPHASGDLSGGVLDKNGNIICPVHGYRFSTSSGRDSNGEGYFLKIYTLEQTAEGIFLRL